MQLKRNAREILLPYQERGWLDPGWGRTVSVKFMAWNREEKQGGSTFQEKPKKECIFIS